jgi:hypothetical protein
LTEIDEAVGKVYGNSLVKLQSLYANIQKVDPNKPKNKYQEAFTKAMNEA